MKVAVDTNVFIRLLSGNEELAPPARAVLERTSREAEVVVSPAVFAELVAGSRSLEDVARFFEEKSITVHWDLDRQVWREAGLRYAAYAQDRRKEGSGGPRRILADFLIGSHALLMAGANLLTSDSRIFANYFPELRILTPADKPPKPEIQDGSDYDGDQ
jgi:predicted nucleic acid-binding protein